MGKARESLISTEMQAGEELSVGLSLRPERFLQYIGQSTLIRKLKIAVEAARRRKEPVEHERYCSRFVRSAALIAVVLARSYSRNSGSSSLESVTVRPASRHRWPISRS